MEISKDDYLLIPKLIRGDVLAFDSLYKKYAGKLYFFALKYLKSEIEAEEIVQSVFVKVWENRKTLKQELSFKSYLFTIAHNDICKVFRKRQNFKKVLEEILYYDSNISDETREKIDYESLLSLVDEIIQELPVRQKEIFIKSRFEGKTTKEIAAELKLSPGTVDNYISMSMKFIRGKLGKDFFC